MVNDEEYSETNRFIESIYIIRLISLMENFSNDGDSDRLFQFAVVHLSNKPG